MRRILTHLTPEPRNNADLDMEPRITLLGPSDHDGVANAEAVVLNIDIPDLGEWQLRMDELADLYAKYKALEKK